jgi:hypothetical protein
MRDTTDDIKITRTPINQYRYTGEQPTTYAVTLQFMGQFSKYNVIKRAAKINVNDVD